MTTALASLGLIAGNRSLPLEFARLAKAQGVQRLVAVAFEGETEPALAELVDEVVWVRVGQLGKLIRAFTSRGVRQCVMLGQVAPSNLYKVRPDLRALGVLMRLKVRNAHTVFGAIADELRKDGVELIAATPWLASLMPGSGFRCGPALTEAQEADVAYGLRLAKAVSGLEIGQTVVVKQGTVLAVEAFEGTDACLRRGGELAGADGGAVAVKVAKAGHDLRFDIPCVGPQTLEVCWETGVAVLGVEANRTLLVERDRLAQLAAQHRLSLVTVAEPEG
ncbi:MAG: LpxI family protein [Verrucomicrobia bacterium]|nr:LpxI family protein [Verrucomicrobiota bacterium]